MWSFRRLCPLLALVCGLGTFAQEGSEPCSATVIADVVALNQPWTASRLGSTTPQGMIYALAQDVVPIDNPVDAHGNDLRTNIHLDMQLVPGQVRLRSGKRPRPLILRVNEGECLLIRFTNLLVEKNSIDFSPVTGIHVAGLEVVAVNGQAGIQSDGTFVGTNPNSFADSGETVTYQLFARKEGMYFLYDDASYADNGGTLEAGLFGAVAVQPPQSEYYRSQVTHHDLVAATRTGKQLSKGETLVALRDEKGKPQRDPQGQALFRLVNEGERDPEAGLVVALDQAGKLKTPDGHPILDYQAVGADGRPLLRMDWPSADGKTRHLLHSDITALITGPRAGNWPLSLNNPAFFNNPASPNRRQPYREFNILYMLLGVTQSFPFGYASYNPSANAGSPPTNTLANAVSFGTDGFGMNYGTAGIASEIVASRLGVGPEGFHGDGADLKFEEFFLSSWACGDPAVLSNVPPTGNGERATKAYFPDDPSNVYHSYLRDHVKFRIINVNNIPHVHHLHAHQWLHSPNNDDGHYLDSQLLSGGATYTAEITYNGSGNRNQTVGDSIFHCHFYPHFAQGLWSLWRVHDVFEAGTILTADGTVATHDPDGQPLWNRALPDGEIEAGTPIPAIVPVPTIGMAPMPANVRLANASDPTIDNLSMAGRRAIVEPTGHDPNGVPIYDNPGYPFFIPSIAGHRPTHPPLDFGWVEDEHGQPVLDDQGQRILLDGGLPRHQALDGEIVRDLSTRFDFSRDFVLFKTEDKREQNQANYLTGSFTAYELPEQGTAVEQAAMRFHARRSHPTWLPNGRPGHFTTNGLPPEPGAPYAAPNVDDEGNPVGELIRYKAANIQMDVVFNKKGWHYPQQRLITLWDDVAPTIQGERPPEPFFFRSHSGDSIEFWHTNLVPNYYDMDDFQIRTPTDIIGQHIHLVKFDVTSSDGAANGFNYEDGTFSPDEVRERIIALNNNGLGTNGSGGIYDFDPITQFAANTTTQLELKTYEDTYQFGPAPYGQNWDGAQTTIQRWYADPLLNNAGEDRTLRTVFTHDHFSPSTHQQAGLYAGMLIEPAETSWFTNGISYSKPGTYFRLHEDGDISPYESTDGKLLPGTQMHRRRDGGPTSWQAMIIGKPEDTYREFALELQDLALSYLPTSRRVQTTQLAQQQANTSLFLLQGPVVPGPVTTSSALYNSFLCNGIVLAEGAAVYAAGENFPEPCDFCQDPPADANYILVNTTANSDGTSCTTDYYALTATSCTTSSVVNCATLGSAGTCYNVYTPCWADTWFEPSQAIGNQSVSGSPVLISGFPFSGLYTVNYTNEPLPTRTDTRASLSGSPEAVDMAFAFNSIPRLDAELNRQPAGLPINSALSGPSGYDHERPLPFAFPKNLANSNVSVYDPYTPLMNAYQGDAIQVRTLVGAHDRTHTFSLLGNKWLFEPSAGNSGYRASQDMGISEHFEMRFDLGAGDPGDRGFADWLWQANSSFLGNENGMWGLLRGYTEDPLDHQPAGSVQPAALLKLPTNPDPAGKTATLLEHWAQVRANFDSLPNFKQRPNNYRNYHVVATTASQILGQLSDGKLVFNSRGQVCEGNNCVDGYYTDSEVFNPYALMYVLASDLENYDLNGMLMYGINPEPLVLRANAGDYLHIKLDNAIETGELSRIPASAATISALGSQSNALPSALVPAIGIQGASYAVCAMSPQCAWRVARSYNGDEDYFYISRQADELVIYDRDTAFALTNAQESNSPFKSSAGLSQGCINTSPRIGFNPQLLAYDAATSNGLNLGFNPDQTVLPFGQAADYYWYAGSLEVKNGQVHEQPIEFGAINLQSADVMSQFRYGLNAALVVEPLHAFWVVDAGTRASATVFREQPRDINFKADDDAPLFREFVVVTTENAMQFSPLNSATASGTPGDFPQTGTCGTLFSDLGLQAYNNQSGTNSLFNYRTEPLQYRYPLTENAIANGGTSFSLFAKYANGLLPDYTIVNPTYTDPETPVFHVGAGTATRIRWLYGGGINEQVATIYGHSWQEEPWSPDSSAMAPNPKSQELGTIQYGPNMVYNLNLASAGGITAAPGDFLITEFNGYDWGDWGLLRVSNQLVLLTEARNRGTSLSLRGMVMDGKRMAAGTQVTIELLDSDGNPLPGTHALQTTTDAQGVFALQTAAVPPGSYVCAIIANGSCGVADGLATLVQVRASAN